MSVYIKGMEMPTDGNETIIRIQSGGTVLDQYGHHLAITAIPVPKPVRLVDSEQAVIILRRLRDNCGNEDMAFALNCAANVVRYLPNILTDKEEIE